MKTLNTLATTVSCFLFLIGCSGDDLNPELRDESFSPSSSSDETGHDSQRDSLTDMSTFHDLDHSIQSEDMRSEKASDDMTGVLSFEAKCDQSYGFSFTLDGVLYCYTNEQQCPNEFAFGTVPQSASKVSFCSDQEPSRGAEDILEFLYSSCEDLTRGEDCASRGVRCKDIGATHLYNAETGTCSVHDTNTCTFQVDAQNGTSCWVRKIEGGGVQVYRGFDILPRPWEYVDSLTPGCQECRY